MVIAGKVREEFPLIVCLRTSLSGALRMAMKRRKILWLGSMAAASCAGVGWYLEASAAGVDELAPPEPFQAKADRIRHLFTAKKSPQPGDWLAEHRETGQSFLQYTRADPNRPTAKRRKIYLVELGEFGEKLRPKLEILREFMGLLFRLEIGSLPAIDPAVLPAGSRRRGLFGLPEQLQSRHILDQVLMPRRPDDAVALLALTTYDLWPGKGWNFVFGQASLGERVGVWSVARYGDPEADAALFLRRMLLVAVHETAHMFGMKHCIAYECGMNGSNSLAESDRSPLAFCPECSAKLWWVCSQDPATRAARLAKFARTHGLANEAKLWQAQADILGAR